MQSIAKGRKHKQMTLLKEKKIDQYTANAAWLANFKSIHLRQIIIESNHASFT